MSFPVLKTLQNNRYRVDVIQMNEHLVIQWIRGYPQKFTKGWFVALWDKKYVLDFEHKKHLERLESISDIVSYSRKNKSKKYHWLMWYPSLISE